MENIVNSWFWGEMIHSPLPSPFWLLMYFLCRTVAWFHLKFPKSGVMMGRREDEDEEGVTMNSCGISRRKTRTSSSHSSCPMTVECFLSWQIHRNSMQYITWRLLNHFLMTWKMFKCNFKWKNPVQNRIDNVIHYIKKTHVYIVYIIIFVKSIYMCMYVCTNILEKDWKQLLVPGVWIKGVCFFFPFFLFMLPYFQELEHLSKTKLQNSTLRKQKTETFESMI